MKSEHRVALVLGAIQGIGKGIALSLAEKGLGVAVNYYDWEENLEKLKEDLKAIGQPHMILKTDLLKTGRIPLLIKKIVDHFGRLDILVNNIERGGWPVVHGPYKQKQWDLEVATTLRAKWWVFDKALPYLKASGNGLVINISSISAIVGRSGPAGLIFNDGYASANRGISVLTETWARIGAPEVRVNEIMLGFMETRHAEKTRGWDLLTPKQRKSILEHTLLKRTGTIRDVVDAVWFIIENAPYMTGSILRLDGGYVLGGEPVWPMPKGVL
ncbi:MAG: SDR family oxidoreductase [Thermodesulfobacteriota bacterium]